MRTRSLPLLGDGLPLLRTSIMRASIGPILLSATFMSGALPCAYADARAQDILKKLAAVYDVKAFQGTVTLKQTGITEDNKPFNLSGVQEVLFKQPNLIYIKSSGPAVGGTQIVTYNGREATNYVSSQNQYMTSPTPPGGFKANDSVLALLGVRFDVQSGKMLNSTTQAGKAAYVVQVIPPIVAPPAGASPEAKAQLQELKKMLVPYELVIDKNNYHLLRVTQSTPVMKMTRTLEITQETFNPTLADSAFVFTPPPGAKLTSEKSRDAHSMKLSGGARVPGKIGVSVSRGSGNPMPPPHASPGPNGIHKP